jgi:hypothetical protein
VRLGIATLWTAAWGGWLASALLLPLPPWRAPVRLAQEAAAAAAVPPALEPLWSIDVGASRQAGALEGGFSAHEAFSDAAGRHSFAWIETESAGAAFASPDWPDARLSLRAYPLPSLAPLAVDVVIDGERRATIEVPSGWTTVHAALGPIAAGRHHLALRPQRRAQPPGEQRSLSLAVDGVAVGATSVEDPTRDRGVFPGWLRVGLGERPAVFVSSGAQAVCPAGWEQRDVEPDLAACAPARGGLAAALVEATHGLLTAILLLLVPGLTWTAARPLAGAARLVIALAVSAAAVVAVFLVLHALGLPPSPVSMAVGLAVVSGTPLALTRVRHSGAGGIMLPWLALGPGLVTAAVLTVFATVVVPPLEDQDMELQATAHALATRLTPTALTNRGTTAFFAHPPLLHFWTAASFALAGRLERVAVHDEAAQAARRGGFVEPQPGAPLAERPHYREWLPLLRRFLAEPQLWATRQVNVVLASVAVGLLALLVSSLTGSVAAGLTLAAAWLSFPEFLVRGAYGGYFALPVALSLVLVVQIHEAAGPRPLATAGALAFLADQKGLLVPAAWLVAAPRGAGARRWAPILGAVGGLLLFAAWGLWADAPAFLYDFAKEHVVRRLVPTDVRFATDAQHFYPSIPALWREFADRYGVGFLLWTALALVPGLLRREPVARTAAVAVVLAAVVFSLTDWRQTKHLALAVPLALVVIAGAWPRRPSAHRIALVLAGLVILRNLLAAWPLLTSFEAVRPSTTW